MYKGKSSLASSSHFTDKVPTTFQKRASQGFGSQQTKHQKTKPNKALAKPLTYYKIKSNSDPKLSLRQAFTQTRIKIHSQWYKYSNKVAQKAKAHTKSSHIWGKGKRYTIIHKATGI